MITLYLMGRHGPTVVMALGWSLLILGGLGLCVVLGKCRSGGRR